MDTNVISQCTTQIIFRVTNPNDIRALSSGREFMSSEMEEVEKKEAESKREERNVGENEERKGTLAWLLGE